ncbi:hypothetical protein [Actinoplanes sp. GCM10030250]|uniref:hypothetical protein n=1 Tax=Actinoplanes sp. GCM10030250 TaxID=3273376 RepID=UPI0036092296
MHLNRIRTLTIATVTAAALTLAAGACQPGGGGTAPPAPTTASATFTTSFASLGAPKCTAGPIDWSAAPITVPAGPGNGQPVTTTQPSSEFFPSGGRCQLQYRFTDLRPGRWRLGVAAGVASGVCEADLKAGLTFVTTTAGSCSVSG